MSQGVQMKTGARDWHGCAGWVWFPRVAQVECAWAGWFISVSEVVSVPSVGHVCVRKLLAKQSA